MPVHRRWSPTEIPRACSRHGGTQASLIYACSDTLRRYCESLWYSGLEYKRPTEEEILAKCGILFYRKPVPPEIMFAFYHQLENLFSMSKVIHTIRTIMDWLDATENNAFRILSIYEMHTKMYNFEDTITDHRKALKICEKLLDHLGSIYFRVRPINSRDLVAVRAIANFDSPTCPIKLKQGQLYTMIGNRNPHMWHLFGYRGSVPSLFLEASPKKAERQMLKSLQERFDEFLIMCHARSRRQLFSRITKYLHSHKRYSTLPNIPVLFAPQSPPSNGLYFAKSSHPAMRWRSSDNPNMFTKQPACFDCADPEDDLCADTENRVLHRLRRWLYELPSPTMIIDKNYQRQRNLRPSEILANDEQIQQIFRWWERPNSKIRNPEEMDRIMKETRFVRNLTEIMQTNFDIRHERSLFRSTSTKSSCTPEVEVHASLSKILLEELSDRMGEEFYHPRSGQYSYRWIPRRIYRPDSPFASTVSGPVLFRYSVETKD
ncbi:unnamed protein product [Calicophoron daubneyi]|uniref:Uncharacterized protein n=1 Tax=Calicophoron daubneyi TaxID=300641 RepID=A0AAV2TG27_CALDB